MTPEEVLAWKERNAPGPSLDPICPDWTTGAAKGSWNFKLGMIVGDAFFKKHPQWIGKFTADEVVDKFFSSLATLKAHLHKNVPRSGETEDAAAERVALAARAAASRWRRNTRRETVSADYRLCKM